MTDPLGGLGAPRREPEPPASTAERLPPRPQATTTLLLLALIGAAYAAELLVGPDRGGDDAEMLLRLGSLFAPAVRDGDWWRLGSYAFLHIGALHLAMNGYALWILGREVEGAFGGAQALGLFAATAIAAGVTSGLFALASGSPIQSAGASGGIFGLFGATGALWLRLRHRVPPEVLRRVLRNFGFNLLINVVIAVQVRSIDWRAHAGGMAAGVLLGLLAPSVLLPRKPWHVPIQAALLCAALLLAAAEGAAVARAVNTKPRHLVSEKQGVEASVPWMLAPRSDGVAAAPGGMGLRVAIGRVLAPPPPGGKTVQLGERRFTLGQASPGNRDSPCIEETSLVSDDDELLQVVLCCQQPECQGVAGEKLAETIAATIRSIR